MADTEVQSDLASGAVVMEGSDFAALLQKEFKPKTEEARDAVSVAVQVTGNNPTGAVVVAVGLYNCTIVLSGGAGSCTVNNVGAGTHDFVWDGKGSDGTQWPDGTYKISVVAKNSKGEPVSVQTDSQGVVDSVDLTANPPLLSIGGQTFTVDQIKRVAKPSANSTTTTR